LEIPFLWIDTLCIVDDDPNEKHNQIANMDQVCPTNSTSIFSL
jgi:hypothetical protein